LAFVLEFVSESAPMQRVRASNIVTSHNSDVVILFHSFHSFSFDWNICENRRGTAIQGEA